MSRLHVCAAADFSVASHEAKQLRISHGRCHLGQDIIFRPGAGAVEIIRVEELHGGFRPAGFAAKFFRQRAFRAGGGNGFYRRDADVDKQTAFRVHEPPAVADFCGVKKSRGLFLARQQSAEFIQTCTRRGRCGGGQVIQRARWKILPLRAGLGCRRDGALGGDNRGCCRSDEQQGRRRDFDSKVHLIDYDTTAKKTNRTFVLYVLTGQK